MRRLTQHLHLPSHVGAAMQSHHPGVQVSGVAPDVARDLLGELPRGAEDEALGVGLGGVHLHQHGDAEGRGLARPGLGLTYDVPAFQQKRHGRGLDGGEAQQPHPVEAAQHLGAQGQVRERHFFQGASPGVIYSASPVFRWLVDMVIYDGFLRKARTSAALRPRCMGS